MSAAASMRKPFRADVRHAIAIGVCFADARSMNEIRAQAIGRAKAGSLADQYQSDLGTEQLAHFVFDRHAAETRDNNRRQTPTVIS